MNLANSTFHELMEVRQLLEIKVAKMAAQRRTVDDIVAINKAVNAYEKKVSGGTVAVGEDLLFHLKIADAAKNPTLKSLLLVIAPEIIKYCLALEFDVSKVNRSNESVPEHKMIAKHILNQESKLAAQAMKIHLRQK